MPARKLQGRKPSEVFAERLRAVRERRRWTQQDLADRLAELGAPTDRATIARTESGSRGLSLDDALAYSYAVGAAPVGMFTISDDGNPVTLAPNVTLTAVEARHWIRGQFVPRAADERVYVTEVADEEWVAYQKAGLRDVVDDVQRLVNAVGVDDKDGILQAIDRLNAGLEQLRRREVG